MTDLNHRRKNRKPVNRRHTKYHNGYAPHGDLKPDGSRVPTQRTGQTDFLDKSMHGWGTLSTFADKGVGAHIGNDFTNGHRGMARAVAGAKKFVRSRIRRAEKDALNKTIKENDNG